MPAASVPSLQEQDVTARPGPAASLDALLDVSMPVIIEIGRTTMTVQELLQLTPGAVIELDRAVGQPVDIFVSDRRLAQGEVVVVGDHFGVRVTRVLAEPGGEAA
jgi:flagellar motor switch protein FliN/FliY